MAKRDVLLRFTEEELARIDAVRGREPRSVFIRRWLEDVAVALEKKKEAA